MNRFLATAAALVLSANAFAGASFDNRAGHVYAFVSDHKTFDDAQDACEAWGMDLVTVDSLAEQDWLIERAFLATPNNAYSGYLNTWFWIGAYSDEVDGGQDVYDAINADWDWISGRTSNVSDFDGSMDVDPWGYDNYGAAVTITGPYTQGPFGAGHEWRISPANYYRAFVCESR